MKSVHQQFADRVELVRLGRTEWRVNDALEPNRLLGYIERERSDRYEIVWMTDPMRWGYATSFEDALVAFGDSLRFTGEIFERRARVVGRRRAPVAPARRSTWIKPHGGTRLA
jgi:hypothetical protein